MSLKPPAIQLLFHYDHLSADLGERQDARQRCRGLRLNSVELVRGSAGDR